MLNLALIHIYEADHAAVVLRIEAEVGGEDGLFQRLEKARVPGLDQQREMCIRDRLWSRIVVSSTSTRACTIFGGFSP